ncbi:hypothetical protein C5E45_25190 [Nocardia nova]|uniref:MFS transporter n=1 Tax=Nocardia nova TaxID=37330 RepID=A0A2S6AK27_9NOCA|nr:hypothetical protein C5E41_21965 [Nocardia nova]PPJ35585.1 hypothetical protein C5E45_25190 [Nocardia nova]
MSAGIADAQWLRVAAETSAACVSAAVAGLAMMMPISQSWLSPGSALQVDLLIFNMPLALTAGALIAAIAVSVAAAIGNSRLAWGVVFCATLAMLVNHTLLVKLETRTLSTLNYIDSMLAGVILGCLAAAVWHRRAPAGGYLFGALASILLADITQVPDFASTVAGEGALRGAPPVWLILTALVLMLCATVLLRQERRPEPDDTAVVPLKPVVSAVVIVSATLGTSVWMARGGAIVSILVGGALLLLATAVAALLLPGRDGMLVVVMVAFASAGSALLIVPRPVWSTVLVVAAAGAGLYAGWRIRLPLPAVAGSIALSIAAAVSAAVVDVPTAAVTVPSCIALAAVAGYALGCAVGPRATSAVVGIVILFVPSAGVALQGRELGRIEYSHSWFRSAEAAVTAVPGLVAAGIGIGCAAIVLLIGRLRPVDPFGRHAADGPERTNSAQARRNSLTTSKSTPSASAR